MGKIKYLITNLYRKITGKYAYLQYKVKDKTLSLGYRGKHVMLGFPSTIAKPELVFLHDYSRLQRDHIIYNYTGKFVMKEYSGASIGLLVVTGNHKPTVGIPHYMLPLSRINDVETDIIVEEDVWIGAKVTLLAGAHIGRGAVIGASSLVNKEVPPYAVAVGSPTRIVASKFTIEQILEHERILYPENKRFSREYLEELFTTYYQGKKSIGLTCDLDKKNYFQYIKKYDFQYIGRK